MTTGALIYGDSDHFLQHAGDEPCALQLGGSDPVALAESAWLGQEAGYQEINLNVGCPSDRVQQGGIGACLMAEPQLVADCVNAMQSKVSIPVTAFIDRRMVRNSNNPLLSFFFVKSTCL